MGQRYTLSKHTGLSVLLIAAMGLSACGENGPFSTSKTGADAPARNSTELVERDVEAPDVFQITEQGLWDGRPSLGGVWVAHPSSQDPERVIVRNEANGKFVIGALFRRERENPGPALQVSSDAAEALGLLAGAPVTLNVTALRREDTGVAPTPAATVDFDQPENITALPLDPVAGASAPIEVAQPASPVAPTPPAPAISTASSLSQPFIQIGIFSVESNARSTADRLRADGLSASVVAQEAQGKPFWRVIVGPAATSADRDTVLAKVKALGFADAYFVSN